MSSDLADALDDVRDRVYDVDDAMAVARALARLHLHVAVSAIRAALDEIGDHDHDPGVARVLCAEWSDALASLASVMDGEPGRACGRASEALALTRDAIAGTTDDEAYYWRAIGGGLDALREETTYADRDA